MAKPERGLGRGLAALLGEEPPPRDGPAPETKSADVPRETPINAIEPNPEQPRRRFSSEQLVDLAASIATKGVLQPILVRPMPGSPGRFQIVAGERRWRAAQAAELRTIPALVRDLTDEQVLEIAIVENVQRADLDPLEEAQGYRALIDRFGHTQDKLALAVGKSRSHVANSLRLLALPPRVQQHLVSGAISAGHARALAAHPDAETLAEEVVSRGLNVRETEALVRKQGDKPAKPRRKRTRDADTEALEGDLSEALGLQIRIEDRGGEGHLRIRYDTLEQLDEICQRLTRVL